MIELLWSNLGDKIQIISSPYPAKTIIRNVSTLKLIWKIRITKNLRSTIFQIENIWLRKCKRCGKYFIMKGNYDTNYCDRVADGQTRSCQALAKRDECSDGKITVEEYVAWMEGYFPNRKPKE